MMSNTEDVEDSVELLMATFKIHISNTLLDLHPRSRLWVGLSAIYSITLKSSFIVLSKIDIHV